MLNHTSSLRYAVAGETPVFTTLRRGRHEIDKMTCKKTFFLRNSFRVFRAFRGKNIFIFRSVYGM